MERIEPETFCPANQQEWRQWLLKNHRSKQSVWLVYYKKNSGKSSITWSRAVDEALCFGWIDSTARPLDEEKYIQFFCRRKPKSNWSKINKAKVEQLIEAQLMMPAGYESIEIAKQNGSWTILDDVEDLKIPEDLEASFKAKPDSKEFFLSLSKSVKKSMLQWVVLAKRPETRQKRIEQITENAALKLKPEQFR
ncbi:YdeI/OmpD-associated family protein [Pedobacter sp.]|uniref:YdeI/OmpD-associated family protein n=1 Tax=Pedobacter sp. TaxID=1411316 RepID=UPI003D7F2B3F